METKEKDTEQLAREGTGKNLLDFIIAKTFARHAEMSEEEFLKDIGYENAGKTEDEAIFISIMNLLIETTSQMISAKNTLKMIQSALKLYLEDEKENKEVTANE